MPAGLWAAGAQPYGAVPSARQLAWHAMETYAFLHFTINTFTDKEWGYGDESPELFQPREFDADRIVEALAAGGMKGVILTCKHHDGFCLWPTKTTEHSVRRTSWRGGKGDVVKEIAEAAGRQKMKFGVYLSPWDRNHAAYGSAEYVRVYREQLRELLTGYGPVFEVWHDGANGGDGFYGGAREKRRIDKRTYYEWPGTWEMVRKLQPGAVIFSDVGPDVRWVGNEKGIAGETCWATYDPVGEDGGAASPGNTRYKEGQEGHRNGKQWLPAECDVSIRPGWFWHEKENGRVKSSGELVELYRQSVGRGASFLLNVPPDRRGLLHEADVASLAGFGKWMKETFRENLAGRLKGEYWMGKRAEEELVIRMPRAARMGWVRLREYLPLGQRIEGFGVDRWEGGRWVEMGSGTSVGNCRLVKVEGVGDRVRVRLRGAAAPALREVGVFAG